MKRSLPVAFLAAVSFAGCGGATTIVKTVTAPKASSAKGTSTEAAPAAKPVDKAGARLGDKLSISTSETTLDVIAKSVIDPLPVGQFDEPSAGMRFVGVRLAVSNTGGAAYSDAVSNGSTLVLVGDEQADPTLVSEGPCSSGFSSDVKIAAGDKRVGCIAFEVPVAQRLRSFQFTPNSGFADDTAEWRLPSRAPSRSASSRRVAPATAAADGREGGASFTRCDANIAAQTGTTTCPFAENAFYEYFVSGESSSISVYSPATGVTYSAECSANGSQVTCDTEDGGAARFAQSAIDAYSQDQAASYASSHRVGP